jgi:hypothetical protein
LAAASIAAARDVPSHTGLASTRAGLSPLPSHQIRQMSTQSDAPVTSSPSGTRAKTATTPKPDIRQHPDFVGSRGTSANYPKSYILGFIPFGREVPDNAAKIAHDDAGRYEGPGVRFDTRSPTTMMDKKNRAFVGRGKNLNITEHQLGGYRDTPSGPVSRLEDSALVSFSRTQKGIEPVRDGKEGYVYFADLKKHNSFNAELFYRPTGTAADIKKQDEVVTTKVGLSDVTAVFDTKRNKTIRYPFTPRSDLAVSDFSHRGPPKASEHEMMPALDSFMD